MGGYYPSREGAVLNLCIRCYCKTLFNVFFGNRKPSSSSESRGVKLDAQVIFGCSIDGCEADPVWWRKLIRDWTKTDYAFFGLFTWVLVFNLLLLVRLMRLEVSI